MIWLTWRQFRAAGAMMFAALAVLAALLALTGPGLAGDYSTGIAACTTQSGGCSNFVRQFFNHHQGPFLALTAVVLVLPALIGLFWGTPLITRELEAGTHRLVWNQSITRTRWLAVKLALTGLAAMTAAGLGSLAVSWWSSPIDKTAANFPKMGPLLFDARGIVPIAYAAFAFALGVTVGMLVRRTVPALAITLVVFVAVQIAMPLLVRPHLLPPTRSTIEITTSNLDGINAPQGGGPVRAIVKAPTITGAWILSSHAVDASGHAVDTIPLPAGDLGVLRRDKAARLPATGDLPALQPLLALPVVRDRDLHRPRPRPRRVLLLADPPEPVLTQPRRPVRDGQVLTPGPNLLSNRCMQVYSRGGGRADEGAGQPPPGAPDTHARPPREEGDEHAVEQPKHQERRRPWQALQRDLERRAPQQRACLPAAPADDPRRRAAPAPGDPPVDARRGRQGADRSGGQRQHRLPRRDLPGRRQRHPLPARQGSQRLRAAVQRRGVRQP